MLIACDPGTYDSGVVVIGGGDRILLAEQMPNEDFIGYMKDWPSWHVVIERLHGQGKNIGRETFEACEWVGRFVQAAGPERVTLIRRVDLRFHWTGDTSGDDAALKRAVMDEYGGKEIAIGSKKNPGPLAIIKSPHCWQALALGLAYQRGCRSKVFTRADKVTK